jgi:hypothetical protein
MGAVLSYRRRFDVHHEFTLSSRTLVDDSSSLLRADHSAIFLAITGSYLAFAGLTMHGTIRLVLLLTVGVGAHRHRHSPTRVGHAEVG